MYSLKPHSNHILNAVQVVIYVIFSQNKPTCDIFLAIISAERQ